jgi:hypothetical protein
MSLTESFRSLHIRASELLRDLAASHAATETDASRFVGGI